MTFNFCPFCGTQLRHHKPNNGNQSSGSHMMLAAPSPMGAVGMYTQQPHQQRAIGAQMHQHVAGPPHLMYINGLTNGMGRYIGDF